LSTGLTQSAIVNCQLTGMLKTRIIILVLSAALVWAIFLLPKSVVENEAMVTPVDSATVTTGTPHQAASTSLTSDIASLRRKWSQSAQTQKNPIFADSLRILYFRAGKFDSAAWFAESAATFLKSSDSYLKAGNAYYEAYTYAVDPEKQKQLAEKTGEYLGKVIEQNPSNLEAKTRIAMTYVGGDSPMQGIRMLREVLEADPRNEFALFNMGMLSIQSGQYDRAIERLTELVAINQKHIQGQLLLGVAYMNKGMKKEAREQFEKVKTLDSDPSVQATADSYLKDLE
jgi:tetratricopeptide (TPR) repeat protein